MLNISENPPRIEGALICEKTIPSTYDAERALVDRILSVLQAHRLIKREEEFKVRLCLDEAVVNAVKHGNGENPEKKVRVRLFRAQDRWTLTVEDEGDGFSPEDVPDQEDPASQDLEHGRGVHIMQKMMDEVVYWNGGSKVLLSKYTTRP